MTDNVVRISKVWQAFTKFIRNQVINNGRCVDTQMIGLFFKDENDCVKYLPSVDYLEAGKFKLVNKSETVDGVGAGSALSSYAETYKAKLKVSRRPYELNL
jgi:hypothetical protein